VSVPSVEPWPDLSVQTNWPATVSILGCALLMYIAFGDRLTTQPRHHLFGNAGGDRGGQRQQLGADDLAALVARLHIQRRARPDQARRCPASASWHGTGGR
jgi:hypothetical protein